MNDPNPKCSNPLDPTVSGSPTVPADNEAVYIQPADPNHSVPDTTEQYVRALNCSWRGGAPALDVLGAHARRCRR